jgi:hypothetical protein
MSLFESGESSGQVFLRDLFNGKEPEGKAVLSIEKLAFAVARGGWPASIGISDQAAWSARLRSKAYLRKAPKRHFVDPSIAVAALNTNPEGLLKDFNTFGFLFESLCIRDLRIYSQGINGEVCHYRDETGLEVDAIITLPDGRWGAIEIKMGYRQIDEAFNNLTKLKEKVDLDIMDPPSFLMVLTGDQYAFRDRNGILVVPISCLRD